MNANPFTLAFSVPSRLRLREFLCRHFGVHPLGEWQSGWPPAIRLRGDDEATVETDVEILAVLRKESEQ